MEARLRKSRSCTDTGPPESFKLVRASPRGLAESAKQTCNASCGGQPFLAEGRKTLISMATVRHHIEVQNAVLLGNFQYTLTHKVWSRGVRRRRGGTSAAPRAARGQRPPAAR